MSPLKFVIVSQNKINARNVKAKVDAMRLAGVSISLWMYINFVLF